MTSAADGTINWRGAGERLVNETPIWALAVIGGAVLLTMLVVGFLTLSQLSRRKTEREQHRREVLALAVKEGQPAPAEPLRMDPKPLLGGIAVSLYGLWGFATDTLDLPTFFAIGFVSMFDVLELRLFALMYKSADPDKGWTPQLRLLQATAWGFVAASAIANVAHAPNDLAKPFMALMPIGAAWVIELDLRRALAGKEAEEKPQQGTKPGPFRLVGLLWRRLWAWGFRLAGLDVNDRADEMVRRARARDAADASYELRKALKKKEQLEAAVGGAVVPRGRGKVSEEQKRLSALTRKLEKKIRPAAQSALEMAETQDPDQGLQLFQRMAWLTRADEVALLDYGPDSPAMTMLEELNVAANAEFVKSNKRAIEAGKTAKEAEEARRRAEKAVKNAEDRLAAVEEELARIRKDAEASRQQMVAEQEKEEKRLKSLQEERALLESTDATAGQLYQRTAKELEATREQLTKLVKERETLTESINEVRQEVVSAREEALRLEGEQKALEERLSTVAGERDRLSTVADEAKKEAEQARATARGLEESLATIVRSQAAGVPARAHQQGRVDARIGVGGSDTRQRVRDLLEKLSPEDRQQSQRKIAALLKDQVGLSLDAVRNHLRAIEQEDAETASVPVPRTEEGPDSAEGPGESGDSSHGPGPAESAGR
ncbi:hypothetical protein [Streptomyces sampsonii]|uniref:hypothetical protein n=1 Tax=Streptomyces sampsonii TaxID=42239 RepID=UPI0008F48A1C|nr:hypothetical protein [Streptomyces sampsonii]